MMYGEEALEAALVIILAERLRRLGEKFRQGAHCAAIRKSELRSDAIAFYYFHPRSLHAERVVLRAAFLAVVVRVAVRAVHEPRPLLAETVSLAVEEVRDEMHVFRTHEIFGEVNYSVRQNPWAALACVVGVVDVVKQPAQPLLRHGVVRVGRVVDQVDVREWV